MKLKIALVVALAVVAVGGVASANLLKSLTFNGTAASVTPTLTVLLDGGSGSSGTTLGLASDSFVSPQANRGVQCNVPPTISGNIANVNLVEQVSNDNVNFISVADAGPALSSDGGTTALQITLTPQPYVFMRLLINGSLPVGLVSCTSNNTDQP